MIQSGTTQTRYRKAFILLLVIAITVAFFSMVSNFILAIIMAFIFSMLLRPFYIKVLAAFGGRPALSSATVLLLAIIAIGLPLFGIFGLITAQGVKITQAVMPWVEQKIENPGELAGPLPGWVPYAEELEPYKSRIASKLAELAGSAGAFFVKSVSTATKGTVAFVINLFVMLYAMFFFLMWGPKLVDATLRYLPLSHEDRDLIIEKGLAVTKATLNSILVIGIIQGLLVGLALWASGIEGAVFWGSMVVPLSAIPGLGPSLIWIPAALYLLISNQVFWGIAMIVWGLLAVGSVDNVLRPYLVGNKTKIPDLLVLLSTLGGLTAFGAVGIVLGPILAAVLITVLDIYCHAFADELPTSSSEQPPTKPAGKESTP